MKTSKAPNHGTSISTTRNIFTEAPARIRTVQLKRTGQAFPVIQVCIGTGTFLGAWSLRKHLHFAECRSRLTSNRLDGLTDKSKELEPEFDWKEFFKLLWPDIWYVIGAILVSVIIRFV